MLPWKFRRSLYVFSIQSISMTQPIFENDLNYAPLSFSYIKINHLLGMILTLALRSMKVNRNFKRIHILVLYKNSSSIIVYTYTYKICSFFTNLGKK